MQMSLESLEIALLQLPAADRSRLLDRLIDSLDAETQLDKAWDDEAARRDAELDQDASQAVDGRAAIARLKAAIR